MVFLLVGCLIPFRHRVVHRVGGEVRVHDARTGAPVADAAVQQRAYQWPYGELHETWEEQTTPAGRSSFEPIVEKEWFFPLMVHGGRSFSAEVCADSPGYSCTCQVWRPERPRRDGLGHILLFDLEQGDEACPEPDRLP